MFPLFPQLFAMKWWDQMPWSSFLVDHNKLWKILKEMGVKWSLYLSPEKPVCESRRNRTWNNRLIQNWERSTSGCILSPCLFNLKAEYIMWNAEVDESQAEIKIARRNTNNFRYADDTTLMAEREEKLKSLSMRVRESNSWLKIQCFKKLRSWHLVPSLHGK